MPANSNNRVEWSALPLNTDVGASPGEVSMIEGVLVTAMVSRSEAED